MRLLYQHLCPRHDCETAVPVRDAEEEGPADNDDDDDDNFYDDDDNGGILVLPLLLFSLGRPMTLSTMTMIP